MEKTPFLEKNILLLDELISLANETNTKGLDDESDDFFNKNINFLSKSYMVLMCAYLESYVKDVSRYYIDEISLSLSDIKLPTNLVKWSLLKNKFRPKDDSDLTILSLRIKDRDIDENVSGNPHKTYPFFIRLGIDLNTNDNLSEIKDQVESIVNKRNNIVHHNDDAGDIGFSDIENNVNTIKLYIKELDTEITTVLSTIKT